MRSSLVILRSSAEFLERYSKEGIIFLDIN